MDDLCNIDHISHPFAADDFSTHQASCPKRLLKFLLFHIISFNFLLQYANCILCKQFSESNNLYFETEGDMCTSKTRFQISASFAVCIPKEIWIQQKKQT